MGKSIDKTKSPMLRHEPIDSDDSEVSTESRLLQACEAVVGWKKYSEDGNKMELIASYPHPWNERERILMLMKDRRNASQTSISIDLLLLDQERSQVSSSCIYPGILGSPQEHHDSLAISPAIRFDIARCMEILLPAATKRTGILLIEPSGNKKQKIKSALSKYNELTSSGITCPDIGNIEFTEAGRTYMFEKDSAGKEKSAGLHVIHEIDKILTNKPDEICISESRYFRQNGYDHRNCEFMLTYGNIQSYDQALNILRTRRVVIHLMEETRWPTDWNKMNKLTGMIDRRVLFMSCDCI